MYALYLAGKTVTACQVARRIFLATFLNQMYPISRMFVVKSGRGRENFSRAIILTTPPY